MDFHIGSAVVDQEGDKLGTLRHVIVDQTSNQVIEIVVSETGLLGRDVLVPIASVKSADLEFVIVDLSKDDLDKLESFAVTNYVSPAAFGAPTPYPPGALLLPGLMPVGAATGLETLGMMPIVDVQERIPEGAVDIEPGTEVWATDGKVGHVRDVIVDDQTNVVSALVIEKGHFFHTDVQVSVGDVASVGQDRVTLTVSKAELEAKAETK